MCHSAVILQPKQMADDSSDRPISGKANVNAESDSNFSLSSNEELIDELTKGLEATAVGSTECTVTEERETQKENATAPDEDILQDLEHSDDETHSLSEDDFIDEEALKNAEVSYTEEERESLRVEAEDLKAKGNDLFKSGEYRESADNYTLALRTCPLAFEKERAVLYSNRAAAKMKLKLQKSAIADCTKAIELNPSYLKAYFRRAQLYEETDKLDEALADYKKILELDPLHREAIIASKRLPEQIHERNEKLKTEMLSKLKDLGNMILRPFGLSTDNFQLNQDPGSGGYSVNFKQNTN